MNTVIIINLNGNAFHLEEQGFQSLRSYLERAQAQLKDNPDKTEIVADLEQAIADKCAHFLRPHKNVLSAAEIAEVLQQMGPVQTDGAQPAGGSAPNAAFEEPRSQAQNSTGSAPKRLYQIREGAMFSGVCNGLAAYFKIDVAIVRVVFVVLALLTWGAWILVYIGMMLVIPFANTGEEHAAAAGAPFNAQEVVDRAKKHYAEFKDNKEWRRHWRQQRREWRRRWHEGAYWWGHNLQQNVHQFSIHANYGGQILAGLMIPFLAIVQVLLFCLLIATVFEVATTGTFFGWVFGVSVPIWAIILLLLILYGAIAQPLRHARRAIYFNSGGHHHSWYAAWDGLATIGVLAVVCLVAYTHSAQVHDFFQHLPENWPTMWNNFLDSIRQIAPHKAVPAAPTTPAAGIF
jgi:phage shock protein PspC (stress-responsive transcriptional regulator)